MARLLDLLRQDLRCSAPLLARDPGFGAVVGVALTVAVATLPAHRAASIEPADALRTE
jgi:ABC-type lipoprotein release transport system permease subunit